MTPSVGTLVEPAYFNIPDYHETLGPEVVDLNRLVGYDPDPEQSLALDAIFGLDRYGRMAALEVAVVCSRQNLKTGLFKQAALGKIFILERRLVVWSAHEFSTSQEAFRDLTMLIESTPELDRRVKRIYRGNGDEAIELLGGQRIKFKARTKAGGRGLTGDDVVLDEAFALQPDHMGALMPTLSAVEDPQLLYGSSAGLVSSDVLRAIRDRGRAGTSPRLAYIEWCAPQGGCVDTHCPHDVGVEGCALDDEENWRQSNPALGRRISIEYIRAERDALPPTEFARERLGWWDDPDELEVFGPGNWSGCRVDAEPGDGLQLGFAVSLDRAWASIGAAAPVDGMTVLGAVLRIRSIDAAVAEAARISQERGCVVAVDGKGPAARHIPALEEAGAEVLVASLADYCDACEALYDAVQESAKLRREGRPGTVGHPGHDDLDASVAGAQWRTVGDRRAWGRKHSTSDVSMLEAVTLGSWAVEQAGQYDVLESIG